MTAQATMTAALAEINAQFTTTHAYDLEDVPNERPGDYLEVSLSRRFGGNLKQGGSMDVVGYRLTVRAVSQTSVSNVRNSLEKARDALEFVRLTVGSGTTTPIQFETEDPADYDKGWFSGLLAFTFAL